MHTYKKMLRKGNAEIIYALENQYFVEEKMRSVGAGITGNFDEVDIIDVRFVEVTRYSGQNQICQCIMQTNNIELI